MIDEDYDVTDDAIDEGFDYEPDLSLEDDEAPTEPDLTRPATVADILEIVKQYVQPQQPQQQLQQAIADNFYDPTFEARKAVRLEEEMLAEVSALYPDLPVDAKAEIRNRIGSYRTYEDLLAAKNGKVHELLADSKAAELFRKGKYVPASLRKVAQPSPVNTERPRTISPRQKAEVDEYNAILKQYGVQIEEADLKGKR